MKCILYSDLLYVYYPVHVCCCRIHVLCVKSQIAHKFGISLAWLNGKLFMTIAKSWFMNVNLNLFFFILLFSHFLFEFDVNVCWHQHSLNKISMSTLAAKIIIRLKSADPVCLYHFFIYLTVDMLYIIFFFVRFCLTCISRCFGMTCVCLIKCLRHYGKTCKCKLNYIVKIKSIEHWTKRIWFFFFFIHF